MKTFCIITFGCKVNYAESSKLRNDLLNKNFVEVDLFEGPEWVIINSCSVTNNANLEFLKVIRHITKKSPNVKIILTGCGANFNKNLNNKNVVAIFENIEKSNILDFILNEQNVSTLKDKYHFSHAYSIDSRTRSFLKIQDGCNYWCSYCIIPQTRGCSRSDTIESIVEDAKKIRDHCVKEIVITGINVGDYGLINNKRVSDFYDLLCALDKVENIPRVRISSIEPNLLTTDIIDLIKSSKIFVEHFHIPLQSGNDDILKSMRRRYNTGFYKNKILEIKTKIPDCCIGVDVIVGFPGETDEYFSDTYNFLKSLPISYLHIFPFSERNNTIAATLDHKIPQKIKNERVEILRELSNEKKYEFYKSNIGKIVEVLFETTDKNNKMRGYSRNYIRIETVYDEKLVNNIIPVKINDVNQNFKICIQYLNQY